MYVIVRENDDHTLNTCYNKVAATLEDAAAMLRTFQIEFPLTGKDARIVELVDLPLKSQLGASLHLMEAPRAEV